MEMMEGASLLSRPAEEFGNDSLVEEMWALKAMDHAEVYFNLLTSMHPSNLRLTPYDDVIYHTFRQDFPDLEVDILTDDILKSPQAKSQWRHFSEKFNKLDDYSYGTLMRADASKEFSAENSILVVRIQFLAIEIARNKEGLNDEVYQKCRPPPRPQEDAYKPFSSNTDKTDETTDQAETSKKQETDDAGQKDGENKENEKSSDHS